MSNNVKLQKIILDPDWIDLSFGEPSLVMRELYRQINNFDALFDVTKPSSLLNWTYQPAYGQPELVKILENKYNAKVVVCNGAKHALAAALFAFKKAGINTCHYSAPYYPANPYILNSLDISWAPESEAESLLITSPNNPCGTNLSNPYIREKAKDRPCIHDAAYYTEIYLPDNQLPESLCDIQIFSVSKMYGLSGLRIGYAVVHNEKYYQDVVNYVEMTTAGVSIVSQNIIKNIELFFKDNLEYLINFRNEAKRAIAESRSLLTLLQSDVLQPEPCQSNSMFAWCKIGPKLNNKAAKVHILPGEIFGKPGYMRLNIAYPKEIIREAIERLNKNKI